jgi:hypothetical protein
MRDGDGPPVPLFRMTGLEIRKPDRKVPDTAAVHVVLGAGERNIGLARLGGLIRGAGCEHDEILLLLNLANKKRCKPPLPDREVAAVARSVMRYPIDRAWTCWLDELDRMADEWVRPDDDRGW